MSGTNSLHGSLFDFLRNSDMDARNFFDQSPSSLGGRIPHFVRNNFGGSMGGPIWKDKSFIFGNYEGLRFTLGQSDVASYSRRFWQDWKRSLLLNPTLRDVA